MSGITILHLGPEDHDVLMRVEDGLFDNALEPAQVFSFLAQGTHEIVLAMSAGKTVGMATGVVMMQPDKQPQFFISEIGVRKEWRRQGIGAALVRRMRDIAEGRGCTTIWLAAEGDNTAACGLYRKLEGREVTGVVIYDWGNEEATR